VRISDSGIDTSRGTRPSKSRILLLCVLAASLIVNVALAIALRHYYVALKVAAVEPTFARHFSRQDAAPGAAGGQPLIVLFGDSRIARWDPLPRAAGYVLLNRGIGGETTAQMLYRFEPDVLSLRPEVVIFQAGVNDLLAAALVPESEARYQDNVVANLAHMVKQATSAGAKVILLTIVPPSSPPLWRRLVWSDRIPLLVTQTNRRLARLHAPPLVHVIDTQGILQTREGAWKPDVTYDTLHLTSAGYAELNRVVGDILVKR